MTDEMKLRKRAIPLLAIKAFGLANTTVVSLSQVKQAAWIPRVDRELS